jgi:O-acetyl-ADP-ribose deacetylase (regulator of RNase III)
MVLKVVFVSLNADFCAVARRVGEYEVHEVPIQSYEPTSAHAVYVSPANSLGFMDGGIDMALSRMVFPGIEREVKRGIRQIGRESRLGRPYLPIGSSMLLATEVPCRYLMVAPTMLLPQPIEGTTNVYEAARATMANMRFCQQLVDVQGEEDVEVIFTSMGCGWGHVSEVDSLAQMCAGIMDASSKLETEPCGVANVWLREPTLGKQPKVYMNTEWVE